MPKRKVWWDDLPAHVGGDAIVGNISGGAKNAVIGKNVTQTVIESLGAPNAEDKKIIEEQFAQLLDAIKRQSGNPATAQMAEQQVELLRGELTKTGKNETPSANTITKVGDWLLNNVPEIAEALTSLFATPAVGKVVGKAGQVALSWAKDRFGKTS